MKIRSAIYWVGVILFLGSSLLAQNGSTGNGNTSAPAAGKSGAKASPGLPIEAALLNGPPTLDLPKLRQHGRRELRQLTSTQVSVDNLATGGGTGLTSETRERVGYLALAGGRQVSRPVRGTPQAPVFVSFFLYASEATVIDVAGARLAVVADATPGSVKLVLGAPEATMHDLGSNLRLATFGSVTLAALPVLTVRVDHAAGVWDIFMFDRILAFNLPLPAATGSANRQVTVTAGAQGAWLLGLVSSDENPLFDDTNRNGIEDGVETRRNGALLGASATAARAQMAQEVRDSQRASAGTGTVGWRVRRIRPNAN